MVLGASRLLIEDGIDGSGEEFDMAAADVLSKV